MMKTRPHRHGEQRNALAPTASGQWTPTRLDDWVFETRTLAEQIASMEHLPHQEIRALLQTVTQRLDALDPKAGAPLSPADDKAPAIRIHTLGSFGIAVNGRPLDLSRHAPRNPLGLLMALIAHGGWMVPCEQISDALWPHADGASALQSFDTTLHRLRKLLEVPNAIECRNGGVSLNAELCWVDVRAFEGMVETIGCKEGNGAMTDAARTADFDRLLDLYRGAFLSQRADLWVLPMREKLRAKFIRAVRALAGDGGPREVRERSARIYERAIEIDPQAEELYRRLMACNAELGRSSEAQAVFRRCQQALRSYLGIELGEETRALYRSLFNAPMANGAEDAGGPGKFVHRNRADEKTRGSVSGL